MGGWVDQVGLKLTQSPTGVGVGVGTELGNMQPALKVATYLTSIKITNSTILFSLIL